MSLRYRLLQPWPITSELAEGGGGRNPRACRNPSHHRVSQIQRRRRRRRMAQIQRTDLPRQSRRHCPRLR
jgi:hypothetical protein